MRHLPAVALLLDVPHAVRELGGVHLVRVRIRVRGRVRGEGEV